MMDGQMEDRGQMITIAHPELLAQGSYLIHKAYSS